MKGALWTELVLGALLVISPWVFGFSDITVMRWVNVLIGLVFVIVTLWAIFGDNSDKRQVKGDK